MYHDQRSGMKSAIAEHVCNNISGREVAMPTPGFLVVLENLGGTESCIRDLCESARVAAERILGHAPSNRPQPGDNGKNDRAETCGLVSGMNDQLHRIKALLSDLRDDLNAINAALP